MLIIVCGLPGSGKSSLSRKIRNKLNCVYFNTDIIRKQLIEKPQYDEKEKEKIYMEMANLAEKNVNLGKNVIVDATFYNKKYRNLMKSITKDYYIIKCNLPEDTIRKRLEAREGRKAVSDANYDIYLKVKEKFEPVEEKHLELDCSLPKPKQVDIVMDYLGVKGGH